MLNLLRTTSKGMNVYSLDISFNGIKLKELIIDNVHISNRHPEITDEEIYNLSLKLDNKEIDYNTKSPNFKYFGFEPLYYKNKAYRLAWCLENNKNYLGVTTCFRSRKYDK